MEGITITKIVRKGGKNIRVGLSDGNTCLVPADKEIIIGSSVTDYVDMSTTKVSEPTKKASPEVRVATPIEARTEPVLLEENFEI